MTLKSTTLILSGSSHIQNSQLIIKLKFTFYFTKWVKQSLEREETEGDWSAVHSMRIRYD